MGLYRGSDVTLGTSSGDKGSPLCSRPQGPWDGEPPTAVPACHGLQAPLLGDPLSPEGGWVLRTSSSRCVFLFPVKVSIISFFHFQILSFPPTSTELTEGGGSPVPQTQDHREKKDHGCVARNPVSNHSILYWYRQTLGWSLESLILFEEETEINVMLLPENWFSAERPRGADSTLWIQSAELGDSDVYFCASGQP